MDSPYVSPNNIGKLVTKSTLSVLHINIQSIRGKEDLLETFLCEFSFKFNAIMLTETWMLENDSFALENYDSVYLHRIGKRGGGICLLLLKHMHSDRIEHLCAVIPDYEVLSVLSGKILFFVCPRVVALKISLLILKVFLNLRVSANILFSLVVI